MARILIIDDEPSLCTLLADVLKDQKHTVSVANDGSKGLEMAMKEVPDVIILDVDMPGLDGYQVCSRLRIHGPTHQVPILMLTGKTELPDAMRGLATGADDYITKPFDIEEVIWRIQVLVSR